MSARGLVLVAAAAAAFALGPLLDDPNAHLHWRGGAPYAHSHDHLAPHDHDENAAVGERDHDPDHAPGEDPGHGSRREGHAYLHATPAPALAAAPAIDIPSPRLLAEAGPHAERTVAHRAVLAPSASPRSPPA